MITQLLRAIPVLLLLASGASGQDWAKQMFDHLNHDFGVVARGAKAEHRFVIQNPFLEEAHIISATSSCGCTTPTITKNTLKTWEKAEVVATVNTRSFMGHKEAAVTVRFDKPFPAEVILRVQCFIRGDVVVQPGAIEFGSVPQGTVVERRAVVQYAGRSDWRVMAVEKSNPNVEVHMTESDRNQGQVTYDLVVRLKDNTPAGYIHEQLVLVTSDTNPNTARVPVTVEGVIVPSLTVRPSPLLLGVVNSGQTVTKHLVVQGAAPFQIAGVQCNDSRFKFDVPTALGSLQLVPITFAAGGSPGNVRQTVHIDTVGGASLDVGVFAEVVADAKPLDAATPTPPKDRVASPQGSPSQALRPEAEPADKGSQSAAKSQTPEKPKAAVRPKPTETEKDSGAASKSPATKKPGAGSPEAEKAAPGTTSGPMSAVPAAGQNRLRTPPTAETSKPDKDGNPLRGPVEF